MRPDILNPLFAEIDWFETLLEEQDVDILAWAFGTAAPPERFAGEMMIHLKQLNYVKSPNGNHRD